MNKYLVVLSVGLLSAASSMGLVPESNQLVATAAQALKEAPASSPSREDVGRSALGRELTDALRLMNQYALPYDEERAGRAAINALLEQADPLGRILPDNEKEAPGHRRSVTTIGVVFAITNGLPQVKRVIAGTDAERAGIRAGDRIETVDGESMKDLPHMAVAEALRGPLDDTAAIEIIRGDQRLAMNVKRGPASLPPIEVVDTLPQGLLYIRMNNIEAGSGRELAKLLAERHAGGLFGAVLDLRGAGGDDLDSVAPFSSIFADPGALLFVLRDAHDQDIETHSASGEQKRLQMPLMVLIDKQTRGAAEVLAAVLKGSVQGVMLLGETTMGDFVIREPLTMDNGMRLYVTTRRLVVGDGRTYAGRQGVAPDITIKPLSMAVSQSDEDWSGEKEGVDAKTLRLYTRHDPVLSRALDLLLGLKALDIWGNDEKGGMGGKDEG